MPRRSAEDRTGHTYFVSRDRQLPLYFFIVCGELSAHLDVTPVTHLGVHYSRARKKLLREAAAMKKR